MAFGRKPRKEVIKVEPAIPRYISLESKLAALAQHVQSEHQGNIRICSDLMAMQQRLDRAKAAMLKSAMECADEFDFASKCLSEIIGCLQGEETELDPVVSQAALTDESNGNRAEPAAIGFLARTEREN